MGARCPRTRARRCLPTLSAGVAKAERWFYERFVSNEDPVVSAASAFLDKLMPILEDRCPGPEDEALPFHGFVEWVPDEMRGLSGRFSAVTRVFSVEQQCALRVLGELREKGMAELGELEVALADDPVIGPRLDHELTSSAGGGTNWQAPSLVQTFVDRVLERSDGFKLDPSARDALTAGWAQMLRRPSDHMAVIVALHEFRADALPLRLTTDLEIDLLRDEEIGAALQLGAGRHGLTPDERFVSPTYGIRGFFDSQLYVGGVPPEKSEQEMTVRTQARERAERVLLALRLFKPGRVGWSGAFECVVRSETELSPASGSFAPSFGWHAGDPYVLGAKDHEPFREFWLGLEKAHDHPTVVGALRRFTYAFDRTLPEDKIVDLLIAAESLFFNDIGPSDRGEFRFRLSIRVALLIGETVEERRQIGKFMRHSYDARSGIVHGGDPGEENLRALDGSRVSASECASALEDVLRRALRLAIVRLAEGDAFPPDWEALMFGDP